MNLRSNAKALVSASEQWEISRALLKWLNEYPEKPVSRIDFEYLPADNLGMALSTIQAAYKTQQYIDGTYQAQYQFKIILRSQPHSNDERLAADEVLNNIGAWAEAREEKPEIGAGRIVTAISRDTEAALYAPYDDGTEDHQILMTMNYTVH